MSPFKSFPNAYAMTDSLGLLDNQLRSTVEMIRKDSAHIDELGEHRACLVESAEALLRELRGPEDPISNVLITMSQFTAMRLFIKWKVFDSIPPTASISYKDLAELVGAEVSLISRLASILVVTGILDLQGAAELAHTRYSKMFLSSNPMSAVVRMGFDDHTRSMLAMPQYFDTFGMKEPTGRFQTIYAFAAGDPNQTVWTHMNREPDRMSDFMISMAAMGVSMPMIGSYDFRWVLSYVENSADRILVVDVGGGKGHALRAICQAAPGLPINRCVLEDLEEVLAEVKVEANEEMKEVQFVATDFHKEQLVKGALVYYIRRCLHDYGDDDCIEILKHISNAMSTDSRLLIVEQVLGSPPSPIAVANDIVMALIGGKERTLDGFRLITCRAGLKIAEVYWSVGTDIAVLECVKL